jgi:hypothetical protein
MTNDKAKLQLALRALDTLSLAAIKGATDADLRVLRSLCQHWEMQSNRELVKRRNGSDAILTKEHRDRSYHNVRP